MKAILFSFVVLAVGCTQIPKKAAPNPLTVLLEKQAEWQATENGLRDHQRKALRAAEEAERRALDLANDSRDLKLQVERLATKNKELRSLAQTESTTRQQAEAQIQQLEQHAKAEGAARQQAQVRIGQLEKHAADLQQQLKAIKKLKHHAKAKAIAQQRLTERTHQLEKKIALLHRNLEAAHQMTEAFSQQTAILLKLLSAPADNKPDAKADCARGRNYRFHHRAPRH
jgi:chromosome segregation ATPase